MPIEKISANSETRLSVKPHAQEANSVTASVSTTAVPTIDRLAPAQREQHQHDDRGGGEDQFLDQLLRLVVGRGAVIARDGCMHTLGHEDALQRFEAFDHLLRDTHGVGARLFRDGQRDGGELARRRVVARGGRRTGTEPDIRLCRVCAKADVGDIAQVNGPARVDADHEFADLIRFDQEGAGLHRDLAVVPDQFPGIGGGVRTAECRVARSSSAMPYAASRAGSSCTRTTRPGPPMV